jgi:hypothetical protein
MTILAIAPLCWITHLLSPINRARPCKGAKEGKRLDFGEDGPIIHLLNRSPAIGVRIERNGSKGRAAAASEALKRRGGESLTGYCSNTHDCEAVAMLNRIGL